MKHTLPILLLLASCAALAVTRDGAAVGAGAGVGAAIWGPIGAFFAAIGSFFALLAFKGEALQDDVTGAALNGGAPGAGWWPILAALLFVVAVVHGPAIVRWVIQRWRKK